MSINHSEPTTHLETKRDPESLPNNFRTFVDGEYTRVHIDISRNVRKSSTLKEILISSTEMLVTDPDIKIDQMSGDIIFRTIYYDPQDIRELVDDINREFQCQRTKHTKVKKPWPRRLPLNTDAN
jgi:hypothetical protein